MKRIRSLCWSVLLFGFVACGDAPSDEAANDATLVAGACQGSADGMAQIAGGMAKVGCPAGRCAMRR